MKKSLSLLLLLSFLSSFAIAAELETEGQKLSYIFGMDIGNSLKQQARDGLEVDLDAVFEAIRASYEGKPTAISNEEAVAIRRAFVEKRRAAFETERKAAAEKNLTEGKQFLADNSRKEGVRVTASGLQYKVVKQGTGAKPSGTDKVTVNYRGTLLDGTEFDSSEKNNGPISFALNRVIGGWTEGLQLMPVGSKYTFYIPPELAYGPSGTGPIGPNSTLIFDVELLAIGDNTKANE